MITPSPRDDSSVRRRVAALATVGMVALSSVLMAVVSVPEFRSPRDTFKEIDPAQLTQLRPDPPPEQPTEQPEEEPEEPQEEEPETTPERIEAPDLQLNPPTQEPTPQAAAAADAQSEAAAEASSGGGEVSVERTEVGGLGASESSRAPTAAALPNAPSQPSGGSGSGAGIAVEEAGDGSAGSGGEEAFAGGGPLAAGSEEAASEGDNAAAVTIQDASQEDYTSVEAGKLIQWMRQNPAALPPGINQLVGYQPSFLSSTISDLSTSQGEYEMYLMCKPDLREIHVVLVQNGEAKYLVDRSFQKQSRKFRVGPIRRSGGTIIGVQTRAQSRGQKSKQFYSVFLSWWDEAKADV